MIATPGRAQLRLGIVVNDVATEKPRYTTSRIAQMASERGHAVWLMGVGDLTYAPDGSIFAQARRAPKTRYTTSDRYLADVQGTGGLRERITVDDLDVLLLRNDPADDMSSRPWATSAGFLFGRAALRHGVIVLNDPNGLARAANKMYFQTFPEEVRPRTLITRDRDEIKAFADTRGGTMVLKPLAGSGGASVFLVRRGDLPNLNQMIDAVTRDGYVIAQEYLPAAQDGDVRLFVMNGQPLRYKGRYAAFRRVRNGDDMRSNVHAGGTLAEACVNETMLRVAEVVRPKLVQDGMFFVGLDIVGDKLMEINVFSPGGIGSAQRFENVNFARPIVDALERKVQYSRFYRRNFDNVEMSAL